MVFVMLYPKISNIKKSNFVIKLMLGISILVSLIAIFLNIILKTQFAWSALCIIGIIYLWTTTIYSIYKNANIAAHVMIQLIIISVIVLSIDFIVGYKGWAISIAIPINIIIANLTMLVLTIVSRKKYIAYALYEIIIFILSMLPMILSLINLIPNNSTLSIIATCISLLTSIVVIFLCGRDIKEEIQKRFHI